MLENIYQKLASHFQLHIVAIFIAKRFKIKEIIINFRKILRKKDHARRSRKLEEEIFV